VAAVAPLAVAFGPDPALGGALLVAFVLGLRHAADPDHLVAVTTLVASTRERGTRPAARLGLAWGAGHALTLTALALPILFARAVIPEWGQQLAEAAIGALIVFLGLRLLWRWQRGGYHVHVHEHGGTRHSHVHTHGVHEHHEHQHRPTRTPLAAFLIGCAHGAGGSAGVGILLVAGVPDRETAIAALVVLALGTAISMAALSGAAGRILTTGTVRRRLSTAIPALGAASAAFGVWYALAAYSVVAYPL
jgi:ABC-type nickel/cobalt efflux system permease component RcnA